jgi:hypothetical protein
MPTTFRFPNGTNTRVPGWLSRDGLISVSAGTVFLDEVSVDTLSTGK